LLNLPEISDKDNSIDSLLEPSKTKKNKLILHNNYANYCQNQITTFLVKAPTDRQSDGNAKTSRGPKHVFLQKSQKVIFS